MNAVSIDAAAETLAAQTNDESSSWPVRNQQWLVRELERLAAIIQAKRGVEESATDDFNSALDQLAETFGLSRFERDLLLLVAGVELNTNLRRAVAIARQGVPRPSFALALDRLPNAHWDALAPQAPLRYWRLIALEGGVPLAEASLTIDERILHYLTGVAAEDETLRGIVRRAPVTSSVAALPDDWIQRIAASLLTEGAPALLVCDGNETPHSDASAIAIATLAALGFDALLTVAHDLPADARELVDLARSIDREAVLGRAVLVVDLEGLCDRREDHDARAAALLRALRTPALLLGGPSREFLASLPSRQVRRMRLPRIASEAPALSNEVAERALARARQQFELGDASVASALAGVDIDALRSDEHALEQAIWESLREAARGGLDSIAQRIESRTSFADLVLPDAQLGALRDITRQLRHRQTVYLDWCFADKGSRGLGLCALFAGDSGTGKTLAAEAIANEARLDLYRIDLATVVSKYIGETEKNLKRLFDAAEASGAVLLFDEADALFGKRSDVKDSHDRYANIEVAYLLQRIEAYRGLAILTTNLKGALDRAFLRRIRFVVQFPFPDSRAREEIWRRQFPPQAPVDGIDPTVLGRLQLSGGSIRSIALGAAFKAADQGRAIDQALVIDAARAEYAKLERGFTEIGA
jgi:hypothetical protein